MKLSDYNLIRDYMQECMKDTVHDQLHVSRVIHYAVRIANKIPEADYDVVIVAATLHDIGRVEEQNDPLLCHAEIGAKKAYEFLINNGYTEKFASHVSDCIHTHRYKKGLIPQNIEAKIVFDADKLDLIGAVGSARAILFGGQIDEPFYCIGENQLPTEGTPEESPSLFREYHRKLRYLSEKLYTSAAQEIAKKQQSIMNQFFEDMIQEVENNYQTGMSIMEQLWKL